MTKSIELETRIITVSKSLENKNFKNSRHSVLYLQNQRQHNEHKMKYMSDQLDYFKKREIEIKKTLLQHNAAVLNKGIHSLESIKASKPLGTDTTQVNLLENEMSQLSRRLDSISIHIIPAHSDLTIPEKLSQIERYLTESQNQQQQT
jgi:archaellin